MLVAMARYGDIASRMNEPWNCQAYTPTAMHVDEDIYKELAEQLRAQVQPDGIEYCALQLEVERGDCLYILAMSAFFSFAHHVCPDCVMRELVGIAPTWHEFHAYDAAGDERPSDFDFKRLKQYFN